MGKFIVLIMDGHFLVLTVKTKCTGENEAYNFELKRLNEKER